MRYAGYKVDVYNTSTFSHGTIEVEGVTLEDIKRLDSIRYASPVSLSENYGIHSWIKKVIFNNPATIVFWGDGTKTVVKRQKGDRYDKEKGLAMCIAKKALGNKGNYCNVFKEWL